MTVASTTENRVTLLLRFTSFSHERLPAYVGAASIVVWKENTPNPQGQAIAEQALRQAIRSEQKLNVRKCSVRPRSDRSQQMTINRPWIPSISQTTAAAITQ
jgi:hypothetical protein